MNSDRLQILCLIFARGGSKGIPRKNIRLLAGKPLIAYSIECAHRSELICRTVVSTDDEEIAAIARQYGAEVPFLRPKELAEDLTPDLPVFQHALGWLKEKENYIPELVVFLRPTGPVRDPATVDAAVRLIQQHPEADALKSVSRPFQTPYKMWRINRKGYLEKLLSVKGIQEPYNMPRQMLPEIFWQNGYVDLLRPSVILEKGVMLGKTILPFVIEEDYIDIDYEDDFQKAEKLLAALREEALSPALSSVRRYPG